MIRCKQKGPHQQVRFRLSLSVLPTAPGITFQPALPTAPQPELCPWPPRRVRTAQLEEAWATTPAAPRHPDAHSMNPTGWSPAIPGSFWSCPPPGTLARPPSNLTTLFSQGPSRSLKTLTRTWRSVPASGSQASSDHGIRSPPRKATRSWGVPRGCPRNTWDPRVSGGGS